MAAVMTTARTMPETIKRRTKKPSPKRLPNKHQPDHGFYRAQAAREAKWPSIGAVLGWETKSFFAKIIKNLRERGHPARQGCVRARGRRSSRFCEENPLPDESL